jgi:hypothetical protein
VTLGGHEHGTERPLKIELMLVTLGFDGNAVNKLKASSELGLRFSRSRMGERSLTRRKPIIYCFLDMAGAGGVPCHDGRLSRDDFGELAFEN